MNQQEIGGFISELRREKKLTQEQLAERLGVNNRTVSRWENGHCMPDLSLLSLIAEELGVTVSELLNGRRMTEQDMVALRDSINAVLEISEKEKKVKTRRMNAFLVAGLACLVAVLLDNRFGILSLIFRENINSFVAGALTGLALVFECCGIYNNNHSTTLHQRKMQLLSRAEK